MNSAGGRASAAPGPVFELHTPLQFLKGVGPARAELLAKLGLRTVQDILHHYPREHQDRRVVPVARALPGSKASLLVTVRSCDFPRVGKTLGQARALLSDASGRIQGVWFKRLSYKYDVFAPLKKLLMPEAQVLVYGAVEMGELGLEIRVEDQESALQLDPAARRMTPVYPLTEGVTERWMRSLARAALPAASRLQDPLPLSVRTAEALLPYAEAVRLYHFPPSPADRDRARERLAFDEFFFLELALSINRAERRGGEKSFSCRPTKTLLTPFKARLGYELTRGQVRSINEIFRDMERPFPMNRLLQGDVGSGKTTVALSAALLAVENGLQSVFLAPTEILASQHAITFQRFLDKLPVRTALLTGSMPRAERKKILEKLADGEIDLLVGTHAVLSDDVKFNKLGLVIIDEQHRFGVRQREKIANKALHVKDGLGKLEKYHPDVLIMTATPIPRTLAMTLYGDLDVSLIEEKPAGRAPIRTTLEPEGTALARIRAAVEAGRQAYVVFPLVNESEQARAASARAATKEFDRLGALLPGLRLGLLHGQMDAKDKRAAMDAFRSHEIDVLIATPVIEVGIDVPNATVIVISDPERFGLAQLHQLRGRVGRGQHASECILLAADPAAAPERLQVFCAVSDGFRLSEEDLRWRGPGEVLGEAQHGTPLFRVGDLVKDGLLIARTREVAERIVNGEVALTMPEHRALNAELEKRFHSRLFLARVG